MPSQWVFAAVVVALLVLVLVSVGAAIGRTAERQRARRGELEFDTPAARRAIAGQVSALRRCNPSKGVHFHGGGDRCECGARPNVMPFAGGGPGRGAA